MKIVYIVSRLIPVGPIFSLKNIVSNLPKDDFEVIIITLFSNNDPKILEAFQANNIIVYQLKLSRFKIFINNIKDLTNYIKEMKPDIIHSQGLMADFVNSKLKHRNVTTLRCFPYEDFINSYGFILGNLVTSFFMRNMSRIENRVACSESLSKRIEDRSGLDYYPIPNGLDLSKFKQYNELDKKLIKEKLGLPHDKNIFISVGNITKGKDPEILSEAFMVESDNNFLVLLGDGPQFDELKIKTEQFSNILFAGKVSNVAEYLNASDYFISASHSEGLPNAVLEAMGCGLPVVLSDIPAHQEIYKKNVHCGLLFKMKNKESLINAIKELQFLDYNLMSKASKTIVYEYFTAKIMSNNYADYYKSLLTQSNE